RWPARSSSATAPVFLNKINGAPGDVSGQIAAHGSPAALACSRLRATRHKMWHVAECDVFALLWLIRQAVRHTASFVQYPSLITLVTTYIAMIAISGADLRPPRPYPGLISTTGRTRRPDTSGSRRKPPRKNGTIGKNVQFLFW
ncbi:hypothetical protein EHF70_25170, partial [Salmonella enterica subsp. enterica serovar Senftenberg]|nr:hypothetical protein [Salmonella enterica subsp. enterica serovar Senftenberg]